MGVYKVARIGYGTSRLQKIPDDLPQALEVLEHTLDLGINHIDTALFYGNSFANNAIAATLQGRTDILVSTKVGADHDPDGPYPMRPAQRPEQLRASVIANLRSLNMDSLPLVNLRRMDSGISIPMDPSQIVDSDDQLAELVALRDEGLIQNIGLSSVTEEVVKKSMEAGIACVQNEYGIVNRSDEHLLKLCERESIAWVPYYPLGNPFSGEQKATENPAVIEVAHELDVSPSQVGLAWLLQYADNALLIPGTTSIEHLDENTRVGEITFTSQQTQVLDSVISQG